MRAPDEAEAEEAYLLNEVARQRSRADLAMKYLALEKERHAKDVAALQQRIAALERENTLRQRTIQKLLWGEEEGEDEAAPAADDGGGDEGEGGDGGGEEGEEGDTWEEDWGEADGEDGDGNGGDAPLPEAPAAPVSEEERTLAAAAAAEKVMRAEVAAAEARAEAAQRHAALMAEADLVIAELDAVDAEIDRSEAMSKLMNSVDADAAPPPTGLPYVRVRVGDPTPRPRPVFRPPLAEEVEDEEGAKAPPADSPSPGGAAPIDAAHAPAEDPPVVHAAEAPVQFFSSAANPYSADALRQSARPAKAKAASSTPASLLAMKKAPSHKAPPAAKPAKPTKGLCGTRVEVAAAKPPDAVPPDAGKPPLRRAAHPRTPLIHDSTSPNTHPCHMCGTRLLPWVSRCTSCGVSVAKPSSAGEPTAAAPAG